ncbi:MAG: FIST signal transduction protein [Flavobacteriales bacterium]|jgi:hypothetical protein
MKSSLIIYQNGQWSEPQSPLPNANLVIATGGIDIVGNDFVYKDLQEKYPNAAIISLSTAGEIAGTKVYDNSIVATALHFEKTEIKTCSLVLSHFANSFDCGAQLYEQLAAKDLVHILVISEGIAANGDELVKGINQNLPSGVIVTGGLAADAGRFQKTLVGLNSSATSGNVVGIGFYGTSLRVSHGSQGGWDAFGPVRVVTESKSNVLYSLDNIPALDLYKNFLGDKAKDLPGAALLFPLCIKLENGDLLVRTILSIDEKLGTMTFAGDIPQDGKVQFMMANFDRLIDGAMGAATQSKSLKSPEWVFMVSCVGRKLVLGQRIDEELESVYEELGPQAVYSGFYSNGEISPILTTTKCSLHNQTMTITTYTEI